MMKVFLFVTLGVALVAHFSQAADTTYNVLLIISDDLRPELNYLGHSEVSGYNSEILTPNLDAFMAESVVFNKTYCQQAICGPSRASFLTGRRPNTIDVSTNDEYFREMTTVENASDIITLPNYFRDYLGYTAYGLGKVFHEGTQARKEKSYSWSLESKGNYYYEDAEEEFDEWGGTDQSWQSVDDDELNCTDCVSLGDQKLAEQAMEWLEEAADNYENDGTNFLMVLGFKKPHLPFTAPSSYFDLYPLADIGPPDNAYFPTDAPSAAWSSYSTELGMYDDVDEAGLTGKSAEVETVIDGTADNATEKLALFYDLRRAYFASVSYIDGLVGDVLGKLEDEGLDDSTVVVFMSDHGYHLMENGEWLKSTTFEMATRVPFIIRKPGQTPEVRNDFVELVDLFPTITAAAGVDIPEQCSNDDRDDLNLCTDGDDVFSTTKEYAFSQSPHSRYDVIGYSVRSESWRYSAYLDDTPAIQYEELYDHDNDPGETTNLADDDTYCTTRKLHWKALSEELELDPDDAITYSCS